MSYLMRRTKNSLIIKPSQINKNKSSNIILSLYPSFSSITEGRDTNMYVFIKG